MQFNLWSTLLGIVLSASLLLGAVLYILTKEEVDKHRRYLYWTLILTFLVGYTILSLRTSWFYLVLLLLGFLGLIKTKLNLHPYLFGAAIGFVVQLSFKLQASYFLAAYGILLSSYLCKDLSKVNALKFGIKLFMNSLVVFLIVFVVPWPESWKIMIFFALLALSLPNQKIFK